MKTIQLGILALAMTLNTSIFAQEIRMDASVDDRHIIMSEAEFFDSGGQDGRYANYEDRSLTLCGENGAQVEVYFKEFHLEAEKDFLYVYDGEGSLAMPMPDSPLTGQYDGPFILRSSGACMTFRITTDFNIMRAGWEAEVFSVPSLDKEPALASEE